MNVEFLEPAWAEFIEAAEEVFEARRRLRHYKYAYCRFCTPQAAFAGVSYPFVNLQFRLFNGNRLLNVVQVLGSILSYNGVKRPHHIIIGHTGVRIVNAYDCNLNVPKHFKVRVLEPHIHIPFPIQGTSRKLGRFPDVGGLPFGHVYSWDKLSVKK